MVRLYGTVTDVAGSLDILIVACNAENKMLEMRKQNILFLNPIEHLFSVDRKIS